MIRSLLASFFMLSLAACASKAEVKPETVQLADDLFMIPLEKKDADGCQGWRLHSETRLVIQAIHYRKADGSFTNNKLEATCYDKKR